ncbi:MAG TPA: hypothetical protein VNL71_21095 [Chloroflexota bacterium]|nr:hypothetical protein [Chloroflexota bacterium]
MTLKRSEKKPSQKSSRLAERSAQSARITNQALDVLLKLEAEEIATLLPTRFGLDLAPILRPLPTELPHLDLHLERLDSVFELTDGSILHLEFQARLERGDLIRFLRYGLALVEAYEGRQVWTVIVGGPGVRQAPPSIDLGMIPYRLTCVLLGDQDGEAVLIRLQTLAVSGAPWSETDRLDLYLLLLMRHRQGTETVAREGLALAEALPDADRPRVIGAILSLAYHYEGRDIFDRLVEGLMATKVWEKQLVETLERGIERGIALGEERGIALGEERGLARGRAEERQALLRRLLEQRFGPIPPALEARIAASDAEALAVLLDRALVTPTLADL